MTKSQILKKPTRAGSGTGLNREGGHSGGSPWAEAQMMERLGAGRSAGPRRGRGARPRWPDRTRWRGAVNAPERAGLGAGRRPHTQKQGRPAMRRPGAPA